MYPIDNKDAFKKRESALEDIYMKRVEQERIEGLKKEIEKRPVLIVQAAESESKQKPDKKIQTKKIFYDNGK